MIGIGPVLVIVGVIAIIGTYVAIIHWALQRSEVNQSKAKLTANRKSESAPRSEPSQPKQPATWATVKT